MKLVKYFFAVVSLSTLSISFSFASGTVPTCPGVTRSVSWSSTNTNVGDCSGTVSSVSPGCSFGILSTGGSQGVTAPTSGTCDAIFTCKGVTDTATLNVVNGSHCCNTGSQVGMPYWDTAQNKCTPYTTAWCQDGSKHGGATYDYITDGVAGYCGCTSPRTDIGGSTGCACPSGTTWNGSSCVAAGATPSCVLSASPSTITSGQSSTLSATVSGVYPNGATPRVIINSDNGTVVSPTVTTTYSAEVDDGWGWLSSQPKYSCSKVVTVNAAPVAATPGACDKTAARNETNYGDASHQPLCVGGNTLISNFVGPTGAGPTYTYTWNCLSPNGGTTASCSTSASCTNGASGAGNFPTCTPLAAPTAWISASPLSVANGVGTTLSWGSSNTTYCERSGVLQNGYTSGTAIGTSNSGILTSPLISTPTTFNLRCMGTNKLLKGSGSH